MKNHIGLVCMGTCLLTMSLQAKPVTFVEVQRPTTFSTDSRPFTSVSSTRPSTSVEVMHPTTQTEVAHPQTNVALMRPTTQVSVFHPQTTVDVIHPQTTVEVNHPQTTVSVFHPQTIEMSGDSTEMSGKGERAGFSSKAVTSMSDFKPMQAKDLSVKSPTEKAAQMGGGDMNLGNQTNQAEKDNVNQASSLGEQKSAQNLEVDPKQNKLGGLEKLLTDRAKFQEKKQ